MSWKVTVYSSSPRPPIPRGPNVAPPPPAGARTGPAKEPHRDGRAVVRIARRGEGLGVGAEHLVRLAARGKRSVPPGIVPSPVRMVFEGEPAVRRLDVSEACAWFHAQQPAGLLDLRGG